MSNLKRYKNANTHHYNGYTKDQYQYLQTIQVPKYTRTGPSPQQDWSMLNNRGVSVVPESNDFGQFIDINPATIKNRQKAVQNQTEPERVVQKKSMMGSCPKFVTTNDAVTSDSNVWQCVDNVEDIDKVMHINQDNVHITETPRLKVIAYKYLKYKKNGVELRKLQRKIVCLEYDIYKKSDLLTPSKKMRLFFAIKPVYSGGNGATGDGLSHGLNIMSKDSKTVVTKEVEIIDKQIPENQSFLQDLQRVLLRRKEITYNKECSKLNLNTLYDIAKEHENSKGCHCSTDTIFNKHVLEEIKELILKNCDSNLNGICKKQMYTHNKARKEVTSKDKFSFDEILAMDQM